MKRRLVALVACAVGAFPAAQGIVIGPDGVISFGDMDMSAMAGAPPAPSASGDGEEGEEASEREAKLVALVYDRRPSTILAAWAEPPKEVEEEAAAEIDAEQTLEGEPQEAAPEEVQEEPIAPEQKPGTETTDLAAEGEPESEESPEDAAAAEEAEKKAQEEAAKEAEKKAAEEAKAAEQAAFDKDVEDLQRNVTLGEWPRVGEFLGTLTEREGEAGFKQILTSLAEGPKSKPQVPPQGKAHLEQNRISPADVLGLAEACPVELERELLVLLGQLLAQALTAGHDLDAFLEALEPRIDDEAFALNRRELARVLTAAGQPLVLGAYLPEADAAIAEDDREGLNLLSHFYLAEYDDEGRTRSLENAWKVTLAVLAVGDVDKEEKEEALTRAVDLAPRLRDELGLTWLEESFTTRPERGIEVLAVIGSKASKALSEQPLEQESRHKLLELQSTAARALLEAAPELADEWSRELGLMAEAWLREANYTYAKDESTSRGPNMQIDPWGNVFYYSFNNSRGPGNAPAPIPTGDVLELSPGDPWLARLDETLRPRILATIAQLLLKVSEEAEAFPYIERLAADHPRMAQDLVDEFLRVWSTNNNPNEQNQRSVYIWGYNQRATGIPLTRSKQDRNLEQLGEWVERLRNLPVELDEELVAEAFTKAHSSAEIYRLETIESIFGPLHALQPATLATLVQKMRANLVGVWRDPALQEEKKTNRTREDIEAEIRRGYELADSTLAAAIEEHPASWELLLAHAALAHDQNNFAKDLAPDADSSARRREALLGFGRAAEAYAAVVEELEKEDESIAIYESWFCAALGATDLDQVRPEMTLAVAEIDRIREALEGLPGEAPERHMERFASSLFTRMSGANPGVKFRYVEQGLAIVGEHELARDARKVYEYYGDLVSEIELDVHVDGSDRVGHEEPFGLVVDIRHTRQIERESGGFGKYLQNQNSAGYSFNFGRPTEDYRDRFEEGVREALGEHFEVASVTFNDPKVRSRADEEYGWRVTPYAYLLVLPKGPQIDRVPSLRLDLDFMDTTGYAVLPIESSPVPIDAAQDAAMPRPFEELTLVQRLDERRATEGILALEIEASSRGLVPTLEQLVETDVEGFELADVEDSGVAVVELAEDGRAVRAQRNWTVSYHAQDGLSELPTEFRFARARPEDATTEHYRYADADLVAVDELVSLEARYGEASRPWLAWILVGALLSGLVVLFVRRRTHGGERQVELIPMPRRLTPFSVIGMLRDIEAKNGLAPNAQRELHDEINGIERYFFGDSDDSEPDLRRIAEEWAGQFATSGSGRGPASE